MLRFALALTLLSAALVLPATATQAAAGYDLPPRNVVDILDAEPAPSVSFSPDRRYMVLTRSSAMPSIADLSRRMLRLAGMRIDPTVHGRFRTSYPHGFSVVAVESGEVLLDYPLAPGQGLAGTYWSHDGEAMAFTVTSQTGTHLHTLRMADPGEVRGHGRGINTVLGGPRFMPDGKHLLVAQVPEEAGAEPSAPSAPGGPNIQETAGNASPTRTYQDLLANPHDEAMFEHYTTVQLAIVGLDGSSRKLGAPAIRAADPAPDGKHLLVTTIRRPYSYLQTMGSFPQEIAVWNLAGEEVYRVADVPLAEGIPIGGVRTGRRDVEWRAGEPATLVWAEALDGGDPKKKVPHRDRVLELAAPFTGTPAKLADIEHRVFGAGFLAGNRMATTEYDRDRRWIRTVLHDLSGGEPKVLEDRSLRDRYGDPGSVVTTVDETGMSVPLQHGPWIYRAGSGATPEGNLPFIDRQNIETLETERLWRCEKGSYERAVAVVSGAAGRKPMVITSYETPETPLNYRLRDLEQGSTRALTGFPDPTPEIRGIKRQLVKYTREDGVPLSAELYLPADYKEGTRLPLIVWAYPREFNDAKTAGQVSASPNRFTRMRGITHLTLVTQGYAIMNNATMPVIGDAETMNDTFIDQIVSSAKAAIDKAVEMGVADPERVGVGGHSYGAFMTANLLAHCDLFKAGVARSGAYNRTLTPFGFQSERRTLWEAKSVYYGISPFLHADKINEPMLMIHGEADNNSGTFPMQSRRMYQAIKGNGGTARLVMLPHESHGYRARESVLHTQAEMIEWFDRYLKGVGTAGAGASAGATP
ncbi:hypothetical protein ABI59_06990 [Acidobacteria bacterium Mor1]|nr:hypothetical protein ABI59_06990 [Acidobacteria bacterium Mor1]